MPTSYVYSIILHSRRHLTFIALLHESRYRTRTTSLTIPSIPALTDVSVILYVWGYVNGITLHFNSVISRYGNTLVKVAVLRLTVSLNTNWSPFIILITCVFFSLLHFANFVKCIPLQNVQLKAMLLFKKKVLLHSAQ